MSPQLLTSPSNGCKLGLGRRPRREAAVLTVPSWTCPTCKTALATPYCPACGEQPLRPHHLTLRDLADQLFKAFSSIDGKLLRSLRAVVFAPGVLTRAYVEGLRKPYLGPLAVFLIANGLFFAMQSASKTNIFSSTLDSHLHRQDWSGLAQTLVGDRLAAKGTTLAAYAPLFDQAAVLHAKSLIILMVFMFAALMSLALWRWRRPYAAHVVFALHLHAFLLLGFCLCLGVVEIVMLAGGPGLESRGLDLTLSVANLTACGIYLWMALRTVYGARGVGGGLLAVVLALGVAALVLAYRFVVFLITLYTT